MGILNLNARGEVSIYIINANKSRLLLTRSNVVLALAADVVARLMGNFIIGRIDMFSIFNLGLLLANANIISYTHPATNQVRFIANFDEASFAGNFDKLGLFSSNMGQIAELSGIAGFKGNTDQLSVTWTITIILPSVEQLEIFDITFDPTFN